MSNLSFDKEIKGYDKKFHDRIEEPVKGLDLYDILSEISSSLKSFEKMGEKNNTLYQDRIESLREENARLNEKAKDMWRELRIKSEFIEKAVNNLVVILDHLDNIQRYVQDTKDDNWKKSLSLVQKEVTRKISELDLTEIPAQNQTFSEEVHNCVETVEDPSKEDYDIVEVRKKGYRFHGKLLRAADVVVVKNTN